LSGAYIGVDIGHSKDSQTQFVGLESPPSVTTDQQGRQFSLHGDSLGSVDIGAPVFYRHLQVGQVVGFALDKQGGGVQVNVFVNAPYDKYV
ncbi:MlaD family protein, partial [Acinetobacter baumannii]